MQTIRIRTPRHRIAAICGALLLLALPGAADASMVKVSSGAGGVSVVYQASGGEANRVSVIQAGDVFTIVDPGAVVQPGTGCLAAASTATCTAVGAYQVKVYADDGDDVVLAPIAVRVKLYGGPGSDTLLGGAGDDLIEGDDGDDRLAGGAGADSLRGNLGVDIADYSDRLAPVSADPDNNADDGAEGEGDSMEATVEGAIGGAGDDELTSSSDGGTLFGGAGDDRLRGGSGADVLDGGLGHDELDGREGADLIRARDVVGEAPECGEGADTAELDLFDQASGCESVNAAPVTQEELDNLLAPPVGAGAGASDGGARGGEGAPGDGSAAPQRGSLGPENNVLMPANPMRWEAPGVALVTMQCSPTAVDGCRGEVILEITERVPLRSHRALPAGRRHSARQHRVGRRRFRAGSGKRIGVRVRLNQRGHAILRSRRKARGRIRIKHRDAAGRVTGETTRAVVFSARKWGRRKTRRR